MMAWKPARRPVPAVLVPNMPGPSAKIANAVLVTPPSGRAVAAMPLTSRAIPAVGLGRVRPGQRPLVPGVAGRVVLARHVAVREVLAAAAGHASQVGTDAPDRTWLGHDQTGGPIGWARRRRALKQEQA